MRPHQLETTLRPLGLSGMLETIEARIAQAQAGELGHVEFLQVLCEDEVAHRDAAGIERRVRAAHFEQVSALEEYDFSFNPKVPAAQIRDLATLRFVERGESVILHGPVGVGKTMLAQALGHQAFRRGCTAAFTKTSRLLADLAGGHADRTWEARLRRWARPAVLIVDDFAMRAFTAPQADDLYELITERAARSTIVTANRQASDWYALFPNPVVAESILDRLVNSAHHVHMDGRSYRPNRRPGAKATGGSDERAWGVAGAVPSAGVRGAASPRRTGAAAPVLLARLPQCRDPVSARASRSRSTTSQPMTTVARRAGCGSCGCGAAPARWSSHRSSAGLPPTISPPRSPACCPRAGGRKEARWSRNSRGPVVDYVNAPLVDNANVDNGTSPWPRTFETTVYGGFWVVPRAASVWAALRSAWNRPDNPWAIVVPARGAEREGYMLDGR